MKKVIMVQGTHSNAGKSLVVTALCRIFKQDGYRVAPFKAQNMSLNAGVGIDGGELGRAQIAQAEAAGIQPHTDMNPILLKPENLTGSQVIINGKVFGSMKAADYYARKMEFWNHVTASLDRLQQEYEVVVMEGAGSPVEINLKSMDIVNMRVARYTSSPVLLVGDIDRGGVFASLLGTVMLLEPEERELVKGFLINKFRGDKTLIGDGLDRLSDLAFNIPTLGVIPYLPNPGIAEEDSVVLEQGNGNRDYEEQQGIKIQVIRYPYISNFDEFDSLAGEDKVSLQFIKNLEEFDHPDAVILPGSKMTTEDLAWLRKMGFEKLLMEYANAGGMIVGICGGYQMMGNVLRDPLKIETQGGSDIQGLRLLPIETGFQNSKVTLRTTARIICRQGWFSKLSGIQVSGYQIHNGVTWRTEGSQPVLKIGEQEDGASQQDGRIWGCYLHGLFENDPVRHAWLRMLGWQQNGRSFQRQQAYDRLAKHFREHVDMEKIYQMMD